MFNVNDTVVYGTDGVCKITEITVKTFAGASAEYYVLQPIKKEGQSLIFVPIDNERLTSKMQPLLSAVEIHRLIMSMPDEGLIWYDDENTRKNAYKEIIATGERLNIIRLIKTLYRHQRTLQENGKKLHASDERFLKEAEKMLYGEFSHVLDLSLEDVLPFITEMLGPEQDAAIPVEK